MSVFDPTGGSPSGNGRSERALEVVPPDLQKILDGMPNGVTVNDPTGRLLYVNEAALQELGLSRKEALEAKPGSVVEQFEIQDEHQRPLPIERLPGRLAAKGISTGNVVLRWRRKGRSEWRWSSLKASPLFDREGRVRFAVNVWVDVTALKRVEEALRFRSCLQDSIMEASPAGILVVSPEGRMISFNRRFAEIWGIPNEVLQWESDRAALESIRGKLADPEAFYSAVDRLYRHPGEDDVREIPFKDGRVIERHSTSITRGDEHFGRVWFFRDITSRKIAEDRERQLGNERAARQAAEDAVHAQEDFLSVASHALRTPVAALMVAEQALRRQILEAGLDRNIPIPVLRLLEALEGPTRQMAGLVDTLLDLARIRAGRMRLELERVDLVELAGLAVERIRKEQPTAVTTIRLKAEGPVVGLWDRRRLQQLLSNLLSNAAQYGERRPIDVVIEEEEEFARLEVRDHGIGISKDQQATIFSRFERAVPWQNYPGLGLGLYVARAIVEAFGGRILVASEPGAGAVFTAELPYLPRRQELEPSDQPPSPEAAP